MKLEAGWGAGTLLTRKRRRGVFLWIFEFFKNRVFKGKLRTAVAFENVEPNFFKLRILSGKKHPNIKLQRLRKTQIWTSGSFVHQISTF